jgi:hypothetical protein
MAIPDDGSRGPEAKGQVQCCAVCRRIADFDSANAALLQIRMHQQHVHKQDHHLRMRLYLEGQMQDSLNGRLLFGAYRGFQSHLNDTKRGAAARTAVLLILGLSAIGGVNALAQDNSFTLERERSCSSPTRQTSFASR